MCVGGWGAWDSWFGWYGDRWIGRDIRKRWIGMRKKERCWGGGREKWGEREGGVRGREKRLCNSGSAGIE